MPRAKAVTPLWVRVIVVAVLVGGPAWWLLQRHDRLGNEARLAAVASQIAGRPVRVRCPGVVGRVLSWDIVEGSVAFDADARPGGEARLRAFACSELDALAEGRRATVLACIAQQPACGRPEDDLAVAVDVLTHESFHLAGIADEAQTECRSLQTMAWTAQQLGSTAAVGASLAAWESAHAYRQMPERYRGPCALGGQEAQPQRR